MHKANLRKHFRSQRRTLTEHQQTEAANQLAAQLNQLPQIARAQNIALYFANDGEISPHTFAALCLAANKRTWYPVVNGDEMIFREYQPGVKRVTNCYGIAEPEANQASCNEQDLDLVLLPLVAFDRTGGRLGMGGGYYDRTFAFKQQLPDNKPLLIGLAHTLQEHSNLNTDSWDIPLDAIVTNREIIEVTSAR